MELSDAATYLQENQGSVAGQVAEALRRLPFVSGEVHETVNGGVEAAAGWVQQVPEQLQEALSGFLVATSVYLFTAFYLLTHDRLVVEYLRESVPPKWSALTEALERNVSSVLHGTVLAVLVTQTLKALVVLGLNLTLGVPLPFTLAAVAFVVGLFPIVGTWTVYVPAAVYLVAFEGSLLRAGLMVVLGFVLSTVLLSLWVRPKLGAEKSEVLDFYWMFLGLVAGVYAFGPEGLVLGPLLIGILKAAVDTLRTPESWSPGDGESEPDDAEAEVLAEEELEHAEA
jgi:predicted PurR-regulated permease PerM